MAYSLGTRFPPTPKYFTLLDPGAYYFDKGLGKQNAAPFLSKTPRQTQVGAKLWTHAIYDQKLLHKIPNCSSMFSKRPRFPYEAFSAEDLEEILCKCGIVNPCECPVGKEREEVVCQGKIKRRIFKGPTPRSILGDEGLSVPSRKDHGFNVLSDGFQHRITDEIKEDSPPFYDARLNESTEFYRGCKWSHRTSSRTQKSLEVRPGPADYIFEREPTKNEICAEQVRAFKRKTSKQLRFIELVQQKNILEGRPGPTTYDPKLPTGTNLQFLGPKAKRFLTSKYDVTPGPADHYLRRDFDPVTPPSVLCQANLPKPACFSMKAKRFKIQREEGPSPASYNINVKLSNFVHCRTAPFGTSAKRFKEEIIDENDHEETNDLELHYKDNEGQGVKPCPTPTWEFKSKTVRMKPTIRKNDEPSPADFPQRSNKIGRSGQAQYVAPFFSSEGRFQPWYDWMPVHGKLKTPGPAKYCLEKPRCPPACIYGPLFRAERFPESNYRSPAPNTYKVNDGIEIILATHNKRLKNNIRNQKTFHWKQPQDEKTSLSFEQREALLLSKSISLLDTNEVKTVKRRQKSKKVPETDKPKMLRTFLYSRPIPAYI